MKRSTVQKTAVGVRLALILGVTTLCLYKFVVVKLQAAGALDRSISEASVQVENDLRVLESAKRLLAIELREHKDWESRVLEAMPPRPEINEVLQAVARVADESGLRTLGSYADSELPLEEDADEKKRKRKKKNETEYRRIPIHVEVTGSWMQVAAFVERLRSLPRQVRVDSIEVSRRDEFFPQVYAQVVMNAFYANVPVDGDR